MPFEIPEPYCWDQSFTVLYNQLDEEHKGLFQGIFACAGDKSSGAKLADLTTKVETHFKNEEKMMDDSSYECKDHKAKHVEFLTKLKGLNAPLDQGTIDFAKDWLVQHIKGTDFKYKGKLSAGK